MDEYKNERREESEDESSAICPVKDAKELVFLYGRDNKENAPERENKRLWGVLTLFLLLVTTGVALYLLLSPRSMVPQNLPSADETSYSGIFESEEIARRCIESSVSLRLGAPDELGGESVSGVIVSEDGWILSGAPAFKGERGRIYARLCNGRDVPVEEVRYDGEGRLTLYRISKDELTVAELRESALIQGEELISLSSCGPPDYACALLSGITSHTDRSVRIEQGEGSLRFDELIQVDVSLGDDGCGAPLFDKKGKLVGVSVAGDLNYFTGVEKISGFLAKIN
ncbi:MAG: trypsin-like peptidase domain-containing protein [Clostridia bacterium]|nr:trypsin-like peptidase domain-containing protein [Clostridia bacterium]MBR2613124.1 trypsin-like peptidase domain-containing protein [Clostridia bacterium]